MFVLCVHDLFDDFTGVIYQVTGVILDVAAMRSIIVFLTCVVTFSLQSLRVIVSNASHVARHGQFSEAAVRFRLHGVCLPHSLHDTSQANIQVAALSLSPSLLRFL